MHTAIANCNIQGHKFWMFLQLSFDFELAQHFSCSVKTVEGDQIFILSCQQLRKKGQHNFIGQF